MSLLRRYWWAVALLAIGVIYFIIDPSTSKWVPKCQFKALTGWDCPGCGSQRAIHALLHGDISEAWHYNAAFVVMIPILVGLSVVEIFRERKPQLYRTVYSPVVMIIVLVAIVVWWVGRNIAGV